MEGLGVQCVSKVLGVWGPLRFRVWGPLRYCFDLGLKGGPTSLNSKIHRV